MKILCAFFVVLFLNGCATGISTMKYNSYPAVKSDFVLCHGYSCTSKTRTGFTNRDWNKIVDVFEKNAAKNAQQERMKISKATALMEDLIGRKTGTDRDEKEAIGFKTSDLQMDCIDETVNTTQYLKMLEENGLMRFHSVAEPTHRGYFIDGRWPHNTAVIKERKNSQLYVVDSFYRLNGEPPYIMPRETWLSGWKPQGSKQ